MVSELAGQFLLRYAKKAIEEYVTNNKKIPIPDKYPKELDEKKGVFVTIYKRKLNDAMELRGCIGMPFPKTKIIESIRDVAVSSSHDPRFLPLSPDEIPYTSLEISILTEPEPIKVKNPEDYLKAIRPGIDGLIIEKNIMTGLLLPQVWKEIPKKDDFLATLCYKAGLLPDSWMDKSVKIYRFQVQSFKEK